MNDFHLGPGSCTEAYWETDGGSMLNFYHIIALHFT